MRGGLSEWHEAIALTFAQAHSETMRGSIDVVEVELVCFTATDAAGVECFHQRAVTDAERSGRSGLSMRRAMSDSLSTWGKVTKGRGPEPVRARPLRGCASGQYRFLGTQRKAAPLRSAPEDGPSPGRHRRRLVIVGEEKPLRKKAAKGNGRPAGKVREVFDRVSKLPRRQQEHIVNWVSAYVSQYEQTKQG
jgi:hypothetical protein